MNFETIVVKKESHIATLVLNRPEKRNALNRQMMQEMTLAIEEIGKDEDSRVLIITGAGRGFCSGADTDLMPGGGSALGEQSVEDLRRSFVFQSARKLILGLQHHLRF